MEPGPLWESINEGEILNISFNDFRRLLEACGFTFQGPRGIRLVFTHRSVSDSPERMGATSATVAAEIATCWAWTQTFDRSWSCARSVTTTKSHGCVFIEEGERRPASRIRSRSGPGIGCSV